MIAQQRLIGNITGRGHGDPLLSPAFPLDCELATAANYRLPDVGTLPVQASRLSEDERFRVLVTTFELQATHFGRFMLISSNIFRPSETNGPVRPTMYMNTVSMSDESGAPLSFVSPESLLVYDNFVTPAQFISLNAAIKTLPSAPFTPRNIPQRRAFFAPNSAAHRSLLVRYWSAASSRLFGEMQQGKGAQGFSVCLGMQFQCTNVIEGAKALLLCDILRYLPPAVRNIASLSAGAPQTSIRDVFKDSALVVVFPTDPGEPLQPTFDLRTAGHYPQISELEDQFISAVLSAQTAFMNDAVARCMHLKGWDDPAQVSFAADYDFALLLYQLEQSVLHGKTLLSPAQCVGAWRQLNMLLINRHRFTIAQVNAILEGIEAQLMAAFAHSDAFLAVIDAPTLPALWQKALTVSDGLFSAFSDVIVACPAASEFPQMLILYPNLGEQGQRRTAQMVRRITTESYAQRPFDSALVASLTDEAFTSVADRQQGVNEAILEGLSQNNAAFPDNLLVSLPLSCRLPHGEQAFETAIELLCEKCLRALPSQSLLENLRDAYARFGSDKTHARLCEYFAACLPAYAAETDKLAAAVACVLPHADGALCAMLDQSARSGIALDTRQLSRLFSTLLPRCEHPERIGACYVQTESDLSRRLDETPLARLDRLCALSDFLHAMAYDSTGAIMDMLAAFAQSHQLLSPEQAESLVGDLWPLCADRDRVAQAFQSYLTTVVQGDAFYYFHHIESLRSLAPFIRAIGIDMTQTLCGILDACAKSHPCVSIDHVSTLIGELLPLCQDRACVSNALLAYADASRSDCQQKNVDAFPWLCGLMQIMGEKRLLTADAQAGAALMAIDHLYVLHRQTRRDLSEQAYVWFEQLPSQGALFARVCEPILTLLDELVSDPRNVRAQQCFGSLRDSLASTASYPSLKRLDQSLICHDFTSALASQPAAKALEAVRLPMQRCDFTLRALLDATAANAENALRREFSCFKTPEDFTRARPASSSDAWVSLHNRVLASVFAERYSAFQKMCKSIDQLNHLNELARRIGSPATQADAISGKLRKLLDLIRRPDLSLENFAALFDKGLLILCEGQQDAQQIRALLEESVSRNLPQFAFPRSALTAMLCSYDPKGDRFDWIRVFALLGLNVGDRMCAPYSAQGQAWLAAIHAICRTLDACPSRRYGSQFIATLNSGPFVDFTHSVQSDKKHVSYFFPEEIATSPLLRQWLGR